MRFFDLRRNSSVGTCETSQGMTAMAAHRVANAFSWYANNFSSLVFLSFWMHDRLLNLFMDSIFYLKYVTNFIKRAACPCAGIRLT